MLTQQGCSFSPSLQVEVSLQRTLSLTIPSILLLRLLIRTAMPSRNAKCSAFKEMNLGAGEVFPSVKRALRQILELERCLSKASLEADP